MIKQEIAYRIYRFIYFQTEEGNYLISSERETIFFVWNLMEKTQLERKVEKNKLIINCWPAGFS